MFVLYTTFDDCYYEETEILGVFSTEDKALEYKKEYTEKNEKDLKFLDENWDAVKVELGKLWKATNVWQERYPNGLMTYYDEDVEDIGEALAEEHLTHIDEINTLFSADKFIFPSTGLAVKKSNFPTLPWNLSPKSDFDIQLVEVQLDPEVIL